jgi:hypothetical protein
MINPPGPAAPRLRYWRAGRGKAADEVLPLEPAGEPTGHGLSCQLVRAVSSACVQAGLQAPAAGTPRACCVRS